MAEASCNLKMTSPSDFSLHEPGEPFLRGLIDAIVLILVLRVAETLFFGAGFYSTLAIHPYWVVIILAAMQNGFFVGVSAAAAAAFLMDWPARPVGVDITAHYMEIAILPVQWLLAALVIGTFRQGQVRREGELINENKRLKRISEDLASEIDRLDGEIAALELAAAADDPRSAGAERPDLARSNESAVRNTPEG